MTPDDDRYVERIAALLAKAESTDSEHERDACVAAAQRLATKHSIDLALAAGRDPKQAEQLLVEWFDFGEANRNLKKHLVRLMSAVARVNDVRMDIRSDSSGVRLYGMASDVATCKALWASLSLQMVAAVQAWIDTGEWRGQLMWREGRWGRLEEVPMDARVARRSFFEGYVDRLAERLRAARDAAEAEACATPQPAPRHPWSAPSLSTEVVLVQKRERVADFYAAESRARGRWSGPGGSAHGAGAVSAGRAAASRARLGQEGQVGRGRRSLSA